MLAEFWRGWLSEENCGVFDATTEMHEAMIQSACLTPAQVSFALFLTAPGPIPPAAHANPQQGSSYRCGFPYSHDA